MTMFTGSEVASHNTKKSCWMVIDSNVYDVTSFLTQHPGGAAILLQQAGTDATVEFNKVHSPDVVHDLPEGSCLGSIDPTTLESLNSPQSISSKDNVQLSSEGEVPHISLCVRTTDFEIPGKAVLPHKSWIYASSSANSGLSLQGNLDDWSRLSFRPRILRNVETVDTRKRILGHASNQPFYVSPMGTLGVIHPAAEPEVVRGIVRKGVHGVISTASSKTLDQIMQSFKNEQELCHNASPSRLFFQLYLPTDRSKAIEIIRNVRRAGYKGIWITVDTPVLGKRTADRYLQAREALALGLQEDNVEPVAMNEAGEENPVSPAFGGRVVPGQLSATTTWKDLQWIRQEWDGPIVLKGIQCADDAKLAMEHGMQGILLSNHGGRQLHSAPSALTTLLEIRTYAPQVLSKLEIFLDGGLRDGADVLKALCLGATAVGVGRPYLYALAAYGAKGIERCTQILAEELATAMRLLGITSLDQVRPDLVNASRLLNEMWYPEKGYVRNRL